GARRHSPPDSLGVIRAPTSFTPGTPWAVRTTRSCTASRETATSPHSVSVTAVARGPPGRGRTSHATRPPRKTSKPPSPPANQGCPAPRATQRARVTDGSQPPATAKRAAAKAKQRSVKRRTIPRTAADTALTSPGAAPPPAPHPGPGSGRPERAHSPRGPQGP